MGGTYAELTARPLLGTPNGSVTIEWRTSDDGRDWFRVSVSGDGVNATRETDSYSEAVEAFEHPFACIREASYACDNGR